MQQQQQGHKHFKQPIKQLLMHFPKRSPHFANIPAQLHFEPSEETFTCVRNRQKLLANETNPFMKRFIFLEFNEIPHSTHAVGTSFSQRQIRKFCGNSTKAFTKNTSVRSSTYSGILSSAGSRWFWTIW